MRKLIIDGNAVFEIDENCMLKQKKIDEKKKKQSEEKEQFKKK